jgi:hypothetical protein
MRAHLTFFALAVAVSTSVGTADAQPIRVFVSPVEAPAPPARPTPTEADRQAASAAWQGADQARKALEKTLKEQHGNKRDKWPADAQARLADAEEARDRANADWLYRSQPEPILEEWTEIIERALTASGKTGPKEHITRVSSADEAQLIVKLIGVRNPKTSVGRLPDRCLMFLLDRGPRLSAEQFARIPRTYRPRTFQAKRLEGPSESSTAWRFESCVVDPYFRAQEALANIVDDFAGAHRPLLTGSAGQ